jgi:hypothetical protein
MGLAAPSEKVLYLKAAIGQQPQRVERSLFLHIIMRLKWRQMISGVKLWRPN